MTNTGTLEGPMRRILVVGCPGAGKSTFARRLAERLLLPVIHLDFHYWHSGWQPCERIGWRERCAALAATPDWIMNGNFSDTHDIRMPRADTLIWLDYPRRTCMRRVLLRIVKDYGRHRQDMPERCREQLDPEFIRFVCDFPARNRPHLVEGVERYGAHLRVTRFVGDRDADAFPMGLGAP
jgi:adenylate kinase family enzyme